MGNGTGWCLDSGRHVNRANIATQYVAGGSPEISFISSGKTVEADVREEFQDVPNVSGVSVKREGKIVSVEVEMSNFDRSSRRAVYAADRKIAKYYPHHVLDVRLIDQSERPADDANNG